MRQTVFRFRFLALILGVVYLLAAGYFQRWNTTVIGGGDSWGYYGYLPATFIHDDLDDISISYLKRFDHIGAAPSFPGPGGELPIAENGHRLIKYTCGVAILQLPFFMLGHSWAVLSNTYEQDGFSFPYILAIILSNLVYLFVGLYLLYKLLSNTFNPKIAFWTILLLGVGTNLFNFAVYRPGMSHAYLFSLYCGLMYASWRFYAAPARKWIVLAAFCAGFITLIRPVEILCLAIPLTYGLSSRKALQSRSQLWLKHWSWLLLAAGIFILCGIPQLLYWKYASGHWYFNSYPGEHFDFSDPQIFGGLFSTQNGWLIYAPIMIFSLLGMWALLRFRDWLWPLLLILPLHIYIAYSWWCWYYINGFGSRPMVEMHAILAIPLAYSIVYFDRKSWSRYLFLFISGVAIVLQLFQNWQHSKGILWSEMINAAYYQAVFGETRITYDALVAFDTQELQPDSTKLVLKKSLLSQGYEQADSTLDLVQQPAFAGEQAIRLTPAKKYEELFVTTLEEADLLSGQWLRVAAWCFKEQKEFPWYTAPSIVVEITRSGQVIHYRQVRIDSKLANPGNSLWGGQAKRWGWVRQWTRLPNNLQPTDLLKVYVMAEAQPVYVDAVSVESWR
ncbi:MAG: hypothetical protein AAFN81_30295 [Bacteroidota bacterium]